MSFRPPAGLIYDHRRPRSPRPLTAETTNDRKRWLALYVLCAGMLMIVLDATIVNVALPSIQDDLGFSQSNLAWVVNAYLIAFGGLLLLAGRARRPDRPAAHLPDRPGGLHRRLAAVRRRPEPGMLIGARFVQGVGGALTSAVILGMIVTMFPEPREQAKAIGVYGFVASAGGSIGLLAGGVLTEAINWHWIFFINLPIGIATAFLARAAGRGPPRASASSEGADIPGARAAHRRADARRLHDPRRSPSRAGARPRRSASAPSRSRLLAAFVVRQARIANPLMPLRLFRSRNVAGRERRPGAARRRDVRDVLPRRALPAADPRLRRRSRSASPSCPSTIVMGTLSLRLLRAADHALRRRRRR